MTDAPESTETAPEEPVVAVEPEGAEEPPEAGRCPVCGLLTDNRCSHT